MREYSTPLARALPPATDLTDDLLHNAAEAPGAVALLRRGEGGWEEVTTTALLEEVRAVARGLVAAGVAPGDRVAIVAGTRWEWTVLDYAVWYAGAASVPVYATTSAAQLGGVLADCGAVAALVETAAHLALVDSVRADLPALRHVAAIEAGALEDLAGLGREVDPGALEQRRTAGGPDRTATLIYTSGTTSRPRACELTHAQLHASLSVALEALPEVFADEDATTLLFLPLAHVLARVVQVGCIRTRSRLAHTAGVATLGEDLRAVRPTFVLGVPRVFEKLFTQASQRATADGHGRVFARATDVAIAWSRAQDRRGGSVRLRARHAAYSRTVYARLRESLGGRCRWAISGGAPLGERLGHFYRGVGLTVLEGYGLTETCGPVAVNQPGALKIGTVGRPLPGTAVRIADDGELLFRGPQVFSGYVDDPAATARVLEADGWLHSGDVGEVDDEGFVRVTGRQTEILVTAGGKFVAPAVLEDAVRAHPLISQCLVVGDGAPFVAALVTLDPDVLPRWARVHGTSADAADLVEHPDLLAAVQGAVDEANQVVSKAEAIRRFRVLPQDWSEEGGELTPALKVRRSVVLRRFREDIAALYR